jgi:hypothetical protein
MELQSLEAGLQISRHSSRETLESATKTRVERRQEWEVSFQDEGVVYASPESPFMAKPSRPARQRGMSAIGKSGRSGHTLRRSVSDPTQTSGGPTSNVARPVLSCGTP